MGVNVILKDLPEEIAKRLLKDKRAEIVLRDGKKRYELMRKYLVQLADHSKKPSVNPEVFSKLNVALTAVNIAATIACTVIICNKLNGMNDKLDQIQRQLEEIKDIQLKTTILKENSKLVEDYLINGKKLKQGGKLSKEELMSFIRSCNQNINTLYSIRNDVNLDAVLEEIFLLLPMMFNYIMLYYKTYYSVEEGVDALHEKWIQTLDQLASDDFMNQIQDYQFFDKGKTNREVNEYLSCQRYVIAEYKQQITQLVSDLELCEGVEGYDEAMQWSRQYAEQQAKSAQEELAGQIGAERAKEFVEQAMQQAALV